MKKKINQLAKKEIFETTSWLRIRCTCPADEFLLSASAIFVRGKEQQRARGERKEVKERNLE